MKQKSLAVFTKVLIVVGLLGGFSPSHIIKIFKAPTAQAANSIENWWPVNDVKVAGNQPFKALVPGKDVKDYTMFWQVDNGGENKMEDSSSDYPHKEAMVDLSGWHWKNNDPYSVKFIAKDTNGNVIATQTISMYANYDETKKNTYTLSSTPLVTPIIALPPVVITSTIPDVLWPTNNATINSVQTFKAALKNMPLERYTMYWQVDGDRLNEMSNSTTDLPHKEALVDVSGWNWKNNGPYTLTFIAKDTQGKEIGRQNVVFTKSASVVPTPTVLVTPTPEITPLLTPTPTPLPTVIPTPTPTPTILPTFSGNPFSGVTFYVNPNNNALRQAREWQNSRPEDAALMQKIANEPDAKWIGNWNSNVYDDVKNYVDQAQSRDAMPVLIAYNIPSRDCGSYSAGGATNAAHYRTWISDVARGIGNRKAAVVLEPDALAGITCLDQAGQNSRIELLKNAVEVLKAQGNVLVYIDAGNSNWVSAQEMAPRLLNAGINEADGFAVNVSNYYTTADSIAFGTRLSALVGNKHFVVDTSRNGQGPLGSEWCNPSGRGLGRPATANTGNELVDAFMWLKNPGESDGTCNGGPSAGVWWPDYALGLARRAEF